MNLLSRLALAEDVIEVTDSEGDKVGVLSICVTESIRERLGTSGGRVIGDCTGERTGVFNMLSVTSWK